MKKNDTKATARSKSRILYEPRPSQFTLFRHQIFDEMAREVLLEMHQRIKPRVWQRDRTAVQRIARAQNLEELLDLASIAVGLGQDAWEARLLEFDVGESLVGIAARLRQAHERIKNDRERLQVYQTLIRALRWRDNAGAQVLLDCFPALDAYGKSLACVVFGLVKEKAATDSIWEFYLQSHGGKGEHILGALWGLVDLGDRRAISALVDQLKSGRWNYELFGWLSMRGDATTVAPLMQAIVQSPKAVRLQPMMAMIGVAQRVGRAAFEAEVRAAFPEEAHADERQSLLEQIFSQPASVPEVHFETFYRGLTLDSVRKVMDQL